MIQRPPRRVLADQTHSWGSQAPQYDRPDILPSPFGVTHWTVPADEAPVRIECLLAYYRVELVGILNYYPEGTPLGEQPHDYLVLVHPDHRRNGIGRVLVKDALRRWPEIDLMSQSYTDAGWELARSILERP